MSKYNNNKRKDFKLFTNMKVYFQNNIEQIKQYNEEEVEIEVSPNSNYVLLPDLKSMVFNQVDLQRYEIEQISIDQSMYNFTSTEASSKKSSMILQSFSNNSISQNSQQEES